MQADAAARAVLGISFEELGMSVARHWQFPPTIVKALAPLPPGVLKPSSDSDERMWQCAGYARELGTLARLHDADVRDGAFDAHIARVANCIPLDAARVRELMARSVEAARNYIAAAGLSVSQTAMLEGMRELCKPRARSAPVAAAKAADEDDPDRTVIAVDTPLPPPGLATRIGSAFRALFWSSAWFARLLEPLTEPDDR